MRAKYSFRVQGRVRPDQSLPIKDGDRLYEFETNPSGVIIAINVTVPVPDKSAWPSVIHNPADGVKLHYTIPAPGLNEIRKRLQVVEGFLSLYGLEKIEIDNPRTEFVPDSPEEKLQIPLYSIGYGTQTIPDEAIPCVPFDLFARKFLISEDASGVEIPLSFFRKGQIDIREERFVEAIYDFYFMLETQYGNGKTRNAAICVEFESSPELVASILETRDKPRPFLVDDQDTRTHFQSHYASHSPPEIIRRIVELRGFLHHHTLKRPGMWHPEQHLRFRADALFLYSLALHLVLSISREYVHSSTAIRKFTDQFEWGRLS